MAQPTFEHLIDIDPDTGEYIQGWPRIRKSIITILTTRLRTRLMRLWWGSDFLDMQDKPINQQTMAEGILAAIEAINAYEPEFRVTSVTIDGTLSNGSINFTVDGEDLIDGANRRITQTIY